MTSWLGGKSRLTIGAEVGTEIALCRYYWGYLTERTRKGISQNNE